MTGRGVMGKDANGQPIKILFGANDAAEWLKEFAGKVTLSKLIARNRWTPWLKPNRWCAGPAGLRLCACSRGSESKGRRRAHTQRETF